MGMHGPQVFLVRAFPLWRDAYMSMQVSIRNGASQESFLACFQKVVQTSGILGEVKNSRYFVSRGKKDRVKAQITLGEDVAGRIIEQANYMIYVSAIKIDNSKKLIKRRNNNKNIYW